MRLLSVVLIMILGAGCSSTAAPGGRVDRILVGDGDTVIVYNREPIQLPVRTVGQPGRAVDTLRPHFVWLSGDSIPLSETGIIVCLKPGLTILGVTLGTTFARVVVRCRPVRSVQMAGPLNLVVGDSLQPPLQVRVLGLDGQPMGGVAGKVTVSDSRIVKVEDSHVIPLSAGHSWLWFTAGDESAEIIVHSYEPVATLDHLRPDEDHVAVRADLRTGESRQWSLPPGHLVIAIRTDRSVAEGLGVHVEGANCETMTLVKGGFACLSRAGASISVSRPATSHEGVVRVQVLLRRTRA
jgi:hypothetical protein